jgi:vacuolar-type H+-ATPase subunit F/Vma7
MAASAAAYKVACSVFPLEVGLNLTARQDRQFIAVIGDEDSVTGLLLAGVGHVTEPPDAQRNFLVVDSKTEKAQIAETFNRYTRERKDIGIVLINQHVRRLTPGHGNLRTLLRRSDCLLGC